MGVVGDASAWLFVVTAFAHGVAELSSGPVPGWQGAALLPLCAGLLHLASDQLLRTPLAPNFASRLSMMWRTLPLLTVAAAHGIRFALHGLGLIAEGRFLMAATSAAAAALTAALLWALPVIRVPRLRGRHRVGTLSFTLRDSSGQRVAWQVWYPGRADPSRRHACLLSSGSPKHEFAENQKGFRLVFGANTAEKLPNFLISHLALCKTNAQFALDLEDAQTGGSTVIGAHGFYGWRTVHSLLYEQLASHGFVVFAPDLLPDGQYSIFPGGPRKGSSPRGCSVDGVSHPDDLDFDFFSYRWGKEENTPEERRFMTAGLHMRMQKLQGGCDWLFPSGGGSGSSGRPAELEPHSIPSIRERAILQRVLSYCGSSTLVTGASSADAVPTAHKASGAAPSLGIFGHSYGGASAAALLRTDERFGCAVAFDSWMYPVPNEHIEGGTEKPLLFVSSSDWQTGRWQAPAREAFVKPSFRRGFSPAPIVVEGTEHLNFADSPLLFANSLLSRTFVSWGAGDLWGRQRLLEDFALAFFGRFTLQTTAAFETSSACLREAQAWPAEEAGEAIVELMQRRFPSIGIVDAASSVERYGVTEEALSAAQAGLPKLDAPIMRLRTRKKHGAVPASRARR